jgi:hypothetical protein
MRVNTTLLMALVLAVAPTALASTTWYVNGVTGTDNNNCMSVQTACKTIKRAVALAGSGDSIVVAPAVYAFANFTIGISVNIVGSGASTTVIVGVGALPHGGSVGPVVTINTGTHVILSKLTITNGFASEGAGIYNKGNLTINDSTVSGNIAYGFSCSGGGIANSGTLTINNSTIAGNSARGIVEEVNTHASGGGIANNRGTVTINNSTVSGNAAGGYYAVGGGIANGGALTINNSTLYGNRAGGQFYSRAGGIANGGTLKISNSTLSVNNASAVLSPAGPGGISNTGTAVLQNSILADNTQGGNCLGAMTSKGYNLSSDNTCNFKGIGDLNNSNPMLGPLQDNGGPTQTQALLSGSPAIDTGNPSGCTDSQGHLLKTDQRGQPRPDTEDPSGCDRGAYESQSD